MASLKQRQGLITFFRASLSSKSGIVAIAILIVAYVLTHLEGEWLAITPTAFALLGVIVTRNALLGLGLGALAGLVLVVGGELLRIPIFLWSELLLPILSSPWKLSAMLFTLILGGFAALLEAGGGLKAVLVAFLGSGTLSRKRVQFAISGFGIAVFFDGLANSMLVGRLMRSTVDRGRVSRVKLAYIADTTSSAVACLAFISTWIAFQLSMIREGYAILGRDVDAYRLFFLSLSANFYCWFALFLVFVSIFREFNPGPMRTYESRMTQPVVCAESDTGSGEESIRNLPHWSIAVVPILVLVFSVPVISYWIGSMTLFPSSLGDFAKAYAKAEGYVPQIMVIAALFAALSAGLAYRLSKPSRNSETRDCPSASSVFLGGVRDLLLPIAILLAAWVLGAVVKMLGAAEFLSAILEGNIHVSLLPALIFLTGALISFSTGTSWGTMGILMPLAIPAVFVVVGTSEPDMIERVVVAAIAAVFSGAVFGDHCSPFSDTTLVASIASGVDPVDHVRTQLPFALIAAAFSLLIGFIPLGLGVSPFLLLPLGALGLWLLPIIFRPKHSHVTN